MGTDVPESGVGDIVILRSAGVGIQVVREGSKEREMTAGVR
jgi:hypothetical protein